MLSEKKKKQLARLHSLKRSTLWKKRISDSLKGKKKRPWTEESKKKKSDMMKKMGIKPPSRKGIKISDELRRKYSLSRKKGKFSHLWRGGVSDKNTKIRGSIEYKIWRRSVFERDDYTCIWCGTRSGNGKAVVLHEDHIKPFSQYPELRFAIDNGRTLCKECLRTTDTYGGNILRRFNWEKI